MPYYEYVCEKEHTIEQFESMGADRLSICPNCGGSLTQRYSPFVIFMGKIPLSMHRKFTAPHYDSKKP